MRDLPRHRYARELEEFDEFDVANHGDGELGEAVRHATGRLVARAQCSGVEPFSPDREPFPLPELTVTATTRLV